MGTKEFDQAMTKSIKPKTSFISKHWQKILVAGFWLIILSSYAFYSFKNNLSFLASLKKIIHFADNSPYGPIIFIILYALRPIFVFPATLLSITAGVLFGPFWGIIYDIIGANLGASLAYFIGRFFMKDFVENSNKFQNYISRLKKNGFVTVFIMRLAFLPYDFVNYLSGSLGINYFSFITATILGSLPGAFSFVFFGASAKDLDSKPSFDFRILLVSILIFITSIVVSKLIKKRQGERNEIS